jgi:MarR family transcriptional regulator for hemolysin
MRKLSRTSDEFELAGFVLDTVPRAMRAVRRQFHSLHETPITLQQMRLLARLRRGFVTTATIAENMGVTLPAITRMVNALEKRALVSRSASAEDRRQHTIAPTDTGDAAYREARHFLQESFANVCRHLSAEERARLKSGLEVLDKLSSLLAADEPTAS